MMKTFNPPDHRCAASGQLAAAASTPPNAIGRSFRTQLAAGNTLQIRERANIVTEQEDMSL
ncbi:hypothetical protein F9K79_06095 [Ochrobactrum sp. Kaboul]|nr:hypothetical protein F9K79_06095 [Ochrobactrum sp. Kaboul]